MCADFSRFAFHAEPSAASVLTKRSAPESSSEATKCVNRVVLQHQKDVATSAPGAATTGSSGGLGELYRSPDSLERPLKLLIVGHNPSDQSWAKGHYYANPNNRMWNLLQKAGIVPAHYKAAHDKQCPDAVGLGFTDVMSGVAESQSCKITDATIKTFKAGFYKRLLAHLERVSFESDMPIEEAYPRVIAFSGVRQWKALFPNGYFDETTAATASKKTLVKGQALLTHMFGNYKHTSVSATVETFATSAAEKSAYGAGGDLDVASTETLVATTTAASSTNNVTTTVAVRQQCTIPYGIQTARPEGWPALLNKSIVYLLPSSSGAAAMSNDDREGPYIRLGELMREQFTWVLGKGLVNINSGGDGGRDSGVPRVPTNRVEKIAVVGDKGNNDVGTTRITDVDGDTVVEAQQARFPADRPQPHQQLPSVCVHSPVVRNAGREVISLVSSPEDQLVYDLVSD